MTRLISPHRKPRVERVYYQIDVRWDSRIHPEDLMRAFQARLAQSLKSRERKSPQVIIEDYFIASVVNHWPPNQQQKEKILELLSDKKFAERLAHAIATGKSPTWDAVDILILQNWRAAHLREKIIDRSGKNLPGLRDWSPMAAEALFQFANSSRSAGPSLILGLGL
jgi:hypothetical protein